MRIKNKIVMMLFCTALSIITYTAQPKTPSVADVFGGMTEDEIARQVQMGQQFLEDLEKFGTPEEKAQFEQMLIETLNSMSEQDFADIQSIAQMVEPKLETHKPETSTTTAPVSAPTPTTPTMSTAPSAIEEFQTLISTITQRIDDIFQKIHSSKECTEELNTRWKSKTTFGLLKRQIHQLKTQKLAQKLSSSDLSDDDKKLVETLRSFLKDLTSYNDTLVIEDDFGLPVSREVEQKHLTKTKNILTMFDSYIDNLMPKLEKFLSKWDPEALLLAKESEEKSKTAVKQAQDATVRRPSPDARPSEQVSSPYGAPSRRSGMNYGDYANFPEYFPSEMSQTGSPASASSAVPPMPSSAAATTAPKAPATATTPSVSPESTTKQFQTITNALEDHFDTYNTAHEQKMVDFIKDINTNYPKTVRLSQGEQPLDGILQKDDALGWVATDITPYFDTVHKACQEDFKREANSVSKIIADATDTLKSLDADASAKVAQLTNLTALEQRFNAYKQTYQDTKDKLEKNFQQTLLKLSDDTARDIYRTQHINFIKQLDFDIDQKISDVLTSIDFLRKKSTKAARRKTTTTTPTAA